jgi:hypothetical protein
MENKKENETRKISLYLGVVWLIGGILLTVLDSKNLFFTFFLGLGIFFTVHSLMKTQILL